MKTQMNIFIPYEKNNEHHEDHLTRGFLILLRYSSAAFYMFYDYVREVYSDACKNLQDKTELKSLFQSPLKYNISTQIGCERAKNFLNPNIISILITDERLKIENEVTCSDRTAVYDGVVALNDDWTFIIENKPYHKNVWEEQLCVGRILGDEIKDNGYKLIEKSIVLTWREIFKRLSNLVCSPVEAMLIRDFQDFVFREYPELFPYETFRQCRNNRYLLDLKVGDVLKSFLKEQADDVLFYNSGWANSIILDEACINQVDYRAVTDNESIAVYFCFGSKVPKSKNFFRNVEVDKFDRVKEFTKTFSIRIADSYGHAIYSISCRSGNEMEFINYWKENTEYIGQYKTEDFLDTVQREYQKLNFLETADEQELRNAIGNRSVLRVFPVLEMEYNFPLVEIYKLEEKNQIVQEFIRVTELGLSFAGSEESFKRLVSC